MGRKNEEPKICTAWTRQGSKILSCDKDAGHPGSHYDMTEDVNW